jgi:hypothetical protein
VPVHADIPEIDAVLLDDFDDKANVLGVKGVGEIGVCGAGAAVANAVFNASGVRVRDFPITLDTVLSGLPLAFSAVAPRVPLSKAAGAQGFERQATWRLLPPPVPAPSPPAALLLSPLPRRPSPGRPKTGPRQATMADVGSDPGVR